MASTLSHPAVLDVFFASQPVLQTDVRHIIRLSAHGYTQWPTVDLVYADTYKKVNTKCVFAHAVEPFPSMSIEVCLSAIPVRSRNKLFRLQIGFPDLAKIVWTDAFKLLTSPPPQTDDDDHMTLTLDDVADLFASNEADFVEYDIMSGSGLLELDEDELTDGA
jgi:hypothetical protein